MSQERNFRKTSGDLHQTWDPRATEKNGFHYDASDNDNNTMEGYLFGVQEDVGTHSSTVWNIHEVTADGKLGDKWSIWGDKVINGELHKESLGAYVRITYKGKGFAKGAKVVAWTKNNSYHKWEVMVDDGAVPYNTANPGATIKPAEKKPDTAQQQNNQQQQNTGQQQQGQQKFNSRQRTPAAGGGTAQSNQSTAPFGEDDLPF